MCGPLSSVNIMEVDFDTQTLFPCTRAVSVQCGAVGVVTSVSMCVDELAASMIVFMLDVFDVNSSASQPASRIVSQKN